MRYTGRITLLILIMTTSVTHLILADEVELLAIIFSGIYLTLGWVIGSLYDKYRFLTYKDPLTEVYNRRYGYDVVPRMLKIAKRKKASLAILSIDINNFKCFNDTYGHDYGDLILKELCRVLEECSQRRTPVIRWGGDEFLVIYQNVDQEGSVKLIQQINKKVALMLDSNLNIQLSIGMAIYPKDGQTMEELIAIADKKMYEIKDSSKQRKHPSLEHKIERIIE